MEAILSGRVSPRRAAVPRMRSRGAGLTPFPEVPCRAMPALAGFRQRVAAPLRARGGAMPRKVRAGRPGPAPSASRRSSRRPFLSFREKRPGRSPPSPAPPRGRCWQRATAASGCRCAPSPAPAAAPWQVGAAGPGARSGARGAAWCASGPDGAVRNCGARGRAEPRSRLAFGWRAALFRSPARNAVRTAGCSRADRSRVSHRRAAPALPVAAGLGGVRRRCARSTTGSLSAASGGCGAGTGYARLSDAVLCAGSIAFCAANSFKGFKDTESPADMGVSRVLN